MNPQEYRDAIAGSTDQEVANYLATDDQEVVDTYRATLLVASDDEVRAVIVGDQVDEQHAGGTGAIRVPGDTGRAMDQGERESAGEKLDRLYRRGGSHRHPETGQFKI